ncbi:thiamine/thiamine pyrophosphate ABC transporter permease [Martelella mediterranea]|uniref:Thiamine transport system permease protein ThiP n=1 Tax=Martelella mediterranea TaxID=293089 RepID=A0A4R3NJK9_9HYPH|nr:thiamine/thiamine pyrophosphate ABC transporter permease [Martelella mediterranea]TCT35273.1 thiamine transport system permease protein [Martelella mediterranea]
MYLSASEFRRSYRAGAIALGAVCLFIAAAVLALLRSGGEAALSAVLSDVYVWRILRFTLFQALLSTALSVIFAIPVARALARQPHFPGRLWIIRLMAVPLGLPVLIGALGLIGVWGRQGLFNDLVAFAGYDRPLQIYGLQGILLAHVYFNLPLAARLFLAGLERVPQEYFKSAAMLSMPQRSVFRFIEWPVIAPLIPGIAGLVFMLCATSFTLVLILGGGPAATTLEVAIYQALRFDFNPSRAVALAGMQIVLTALVLFGLSFFPKPKDPGTSADTTQTRPDSRKGRLRLADSGLIGLFAVFLALPLLIIVFKGVQADLLKIIREPVFLRALATSLSIAFSAAIICLAIALSFIAATSAIAAMKHPSSFDRGLSDLMGAMGSLVLLVPPIVLGTGWFLLVRPFGLTEMAAPVIVVAINTLMALPFVLRVLQPAIAIHRSRTARLSASLGLSGFNRFKTIDWPGLRKPLTTAMAFAMALSLGDLGAVALFGGNELMTLPWLLYSRLGSYRTADANGLALILGFVCLLLMIAGTRGQKARAGGI